MSLMKFKKSKPKSSDTFAPGGQGLFLKKPSLDPAKTFHWDGLDTLPFFASLRVSSRQNHPADLGKGKLLKNTREICENTTYKKMLTGIEMIKVTTGLSQRRY